MPSVKLIYHFRHIPDILRTFPASPYVTITRALYKIMELPVASLRLEDSVNFPFVRVIHNHRLRFRGWLAGGRRWIAVEQRDVQSVVLPDRIWKVKFLCILIDDLTYPVRSCLFVIQLL
jgi:hypothetical protein